MQSKAKTVAQYLAELPADRREAIAKVREVVNAHLPTGYEEGMQYGMIGWFVPHSVFPKGYHCDPKQPLPFAALASQKNYMSLYLCTPYMQPGELQWLEGAWRGAGKRLDMGKSCVRFRRLEDLPLDVVGESIARWPVTRFIAAYEGAMEANAARSPARRTASAKKKVAKRAGKKVARKASKKVGKKAGKKKTAKKKSGGRAR